MPDSTTMDMLRILSQQTEHVANMIEMQTRLMEETRRSEGFDTVVMVALRKNIKETGARVVALTKEAKFIYTGHTQGPLKMENL